jgi:putative DNA primase/helicase
MVETASAKRSGTYRSGASGCDVRLFRDAERVADEREQKKIAEWARGSQSSERLKAMWTLAKADLAVSPEELDTDPMLLNVENGTIELRNGALRPHRPEDLITKLAPVEFDPAAHAPRFYKFLKQILVEEELIAFVQRFLGYSLTGSTKERSLAVLHGVGKNGKSTLVELFQDLMGDYSSVAHPNTIMRQSFSDSTAQYQLAEPKGARFVSVSETKRGVELEEAVVKQITGSDTISARAPYGKPFTYRPQFKLWLSTNHKPEIPEGSEAIWDRMRLIPFTKRFEGKGDDTKLPAKLREELPGVLAWAVRGCVDWGSGGLGTSKAVEDATAKYRSETDVLDRFFEDACEFGPKCKIAKKDLYHAWARWCDAEGADPGEQVGFTRTVGERGIIRGFSEKKVKGTRVWVGIQLATPPSDDIVAPPQNPSKQGGITASGGQLSSNSQNFSPENSHEGGFGKTGESCPTCPPGENIPSLTAGGRRGTRRDDARN